MYFLTRCRNEGMKELKEVLYQSDDKDMLKKIWVGLAHGYCSAYEDKDGFMWYLDIESDDEEDQEDILEENPVSVDKKKTEKVEIRVSLDQKIKIRNQAKTYGLTVSAYLVMLAMRDINY